MLATACLSLAANLWMRQQRAAPPQDRWRELSDRLELAALSSALLMPPPPAAAAPPPPPAVASDPVASAAASTVSLHDEPRRRRQPKPPPAKRPAAATARRPDATAAKAMPPRAAKPPMEVAAVAGATGATGKLAVLDSEAGVRAGSHCADEANPRSRGRQQCPQASAITAQLDAAAAEEEAAPGAPICLFTALTDAYLEGHLVFVRSAKRHTPVMRGGRPPPMYILDQALSEASRRAAEQSYGDVRWVGSGWKSVGGGDVQAASERERLTKFALNKEKVARLPPRLVLS